MDIFGEADRLDTLTSLGSWDEIDAAQRLLAAVEQDDSDLGAYAQFIGLRYLGAALMEGAQRDYPRSANAFARLRGMAYGIYGPVVEQTIAVMSGRAHELARRFGEAAAEYGRAIDLSREAGGNPKAEAAIAMRMAYAYSRARALDPLRGMVGGFHATGYRELEAHSRLALANALGNAGTDHAAERIDEYRQAAHLFEEIGQPGYAGHCLHGALLTTLLANWSHPGDAEAVEPLAAHAALLLSAAGWYAEKGDVELRGFEPLRSSAA